MTQQNPIAPTISGTLANQTTVSETPIDPFAGVTIGDANGGATDTLTITLSGAGGVLSGAGLTAVDDDVYTLSGTTTTIDAELDALSFTPTGGAPDTTSTTSFTLTDVTSASTILANFGGGGALAPSGVIGDAAGDLFGTTQSGGAYGDGALFEYVAATGALQTLASFDGADGSAPIGNLIADAAGDLFGTTFNGGAYGGGAIFEYVKATGTLETLASFQTFDGGQTVQLSGLSADAAGDLFGETQDGGDDEGGSIFEYVAATGALTTLASFEGADGDFPVGGVIADSAGDVFGVTASGGDDNYGTIFEYVAATGALTTLASFDYSNGANATGGVIADAAGDLFGTTSVGGAHGDGTVFEYVKATGALITLASFDGSDGSYSDAGLIADAAGDLFGTTYSGGAYGLGTVFEYVKATGALTTLMSFDGADGEYPEVSLTLNAAGDLVGTTGGGGANGEGVVFEIPVAAVDTVTSVTDTDPPVAVAPTITGTLANQTTVSETAIYPFAGVAIHDLNGGATDTLTITLSGAGGVLSGAGLTAVDDDVYTLSGTTTTIDAELDALSFTPTGGAPNTTSTTSFTLTDVTSALTTLANFGGAGGARSPSGVIGDAAGDLFGTTEDGGANLGGTIFEYVAATGTLTTLASFNAASGLGSDDGLVADAAGDLFGATPAGGAYDGGTIFEYVAATGALKTLASFPVYHYNQAFPSDLIADAAGDLFGTTIDGGADGYGSIFEYVAATGALTTLVSFDGPNGFSPFSSLIADAAGDLFGTTAGGGANGDGSIFEYVKATGALITLASFSGAVAVPQGPLMSDAAGDLFGTTTGGGADRDGTVFEYVKATGALVTLANFDGADGANPVAGVISDAAGDLFGTTNGGGAYGYGTVFEIVKATGALTTLFSFDIADGWNPRSSLVLNAAGDLVGTTIRGGANGDGVVFEIPVAAVDTVTSVTDTDPAVAPKIAGTLGGQIVGVSGTIDPFAGVKITDANANATDALTVTIQGGGRLSGTGVVATSLAGQYTISAASLATLDADIEAAVYTPAAGAAAQQIVFKLTDTAALGAGKSISSATDSTTTLTVDPGPTAGAVTGAVNLGQTLNLTTLILAAAKAGLKGDVLTITADGTSGTLGTVTLVNGQLVYSATGAGLQHVGANAKISDSFTFTISDQYGDTATATAKVTVSNPADTINGPQYGNGTIEGTSGADIINAFGWYNTIYDNGGNDTVNAGSGNATVYTSSGDVVVNLQGYYDVVSGGNGWDNVTGSLGNATVTLGNGYDSVTTGGYYNLITVGSGDDTINAGLGNATVTAGAGVDTIRIAGYGDNVTLNGSTASVTAGAGQDIVTANGGHDTLAFAGYNDVAILEGTLTASITDSASGLLAKVYSSAETLTITGFGSTDSTGVIDLLSGAGGYKTAAAAFAALRSDGHGGEMLSLGASGSIDFSGTSLSKLHASNFAVG